LTIAEDEPELVEQNIQSGRVAGDTADSEVRRFAGLSMLRVADSVLSTTRIEVRSNENRPNSAARTVQQVRPLKGPKEQNLVR